jgi:hypothetical protein
VKWKEREREKREKREKKKKSFEDHTISHTTLEKK